MQSRLTYALSVELKLGLYISIRDLRLLHIELLAAVRTVIVLSAPGQRSRTGLRHSHTLRFRLRRQVLVSVQERKGQPMVEQTFYVVSLRTACVWATWSLHRDRSTEFS